MIAHQEDLGDDWLQDQVRFVERALLRDLGEHLPPHRISEAVAHATDHFRGARVRPFLPMLIGRAARQELRGELPRRTAA